MPTYKCPKCKKEIFETIVYKKEPDKVVCPYCHNKFNRPGHPVEEKDY